MDRETREVINGLRVTNGFLGGIVFGLVAVVMVLFAGACEVEAQQDGPQWATGYDLGLNENVVLSIWADPVETPAHLSSKAQVVLLCNGSEHAASLSFDPGHRLPDIEPVGEITNKIRAHKITLLRDGKLDAGDEVNGLQVRDDRENLIFYGNWAKRFMAVIRETEDVFAVWMPWEGGRIAFMWSADGLADAVSRLRCERTE